MALSLSEKFHQLSGHKVEDFNKPLHLVVGDHGAGKTLLLHALKEEAISGNIDCAFLACLAEPPKQQSFKTAESFSPLLELTKNSKHTEKIYECLCSQAKLDEFTSGGNYLVRLLSFILENKSKSLILIDDIETGIDFLIQQELVGWIKDQSKARLIVTHHSPFIMGNGGDRDYCHCAISIDRGEQS